MYPNPKATHYVTSYHHIDDDRCCVPLVSGLYDEPAWHRAPDDPEDEARALAELRNELGEMFRAAGWEGEGTLDCIIVAPFLIQERHGACDVIFHVKQSNNGTSFLAVPCGLELAKVIGEPIRSERVLSSFGELERAAREQMG